MPNRRTILCNTRILNAPLTGVQRVTIEILKRLPDVQTIQPSPRCKGPLGHLWEQAILPFHAAGKTLWSPSNTGPLAVKRHVVTVHDLATLECPEGYSRGFRGYYNWLFPRLLPNLPAIITVSEYTKQRIIHHYKIPEDRIHVTPLGIDHTRFVPQTPEAVAAVRQRLNLPQKYILFLGALSGRKNVATLIEAWRIAHKHLPEDTGLVIAGAAGAAHVFDGQALPTLPPRTQLTGRIAEADMAPLLGGANVFAFPSVYEGFGLPPLEAMACGTPCMVANATSLPEVVGDAALLVNPLNAEAMAQNLVTLINDAPLRQRLSQAGIKRAQQFTWEACAATTHNILSNV